LIISALLVSVWFLTDKLLNSKQANVSFAKNKNITIKLQRRRELKKRILIIDSANLIHNFKYSYINGAVDNLVEPFLLEIQKLVHRLNPNIIVLGNDDPNKK
jgi:aromatic ring-opening dioxygenase catalytic subunit (LigB family)